jgi:hypothetical protein
VIEKAAAQKEIIAAAAVRYQNTAPAPVSPR